MTLDQINNTIGKKVKLIFGEHDQRFPVIGKFVRLQDAEYLDTKYMARFVPASKMDFWSDEDPRAALTRIFVVKDITQVINVTV